MICRNELKIVSGGQTGVDRGALQTAMDLGLEWGGWAPKGWRAENGTIPPLYRANMREHASANYLGRTRRNVVDSHATLILADAYPIGGGTLRTRDFCTNLTQDPSLPLAVSLLPFHPQPCPRLPPSLP